MRSSTACGVVIIVGSIPNVTSTTCWIAGSEAIRKAAICSDPKYVASWFNSTKSFQRFLQEQKRIVTSPYSLSTPEVSSRVRWCTATGAPPPLLLLLLLPPPAAPPLTPPPAPPPPAVAAVTNVWSCPDISNNCWPKYQFDFRPPMLLLTHPPPSVLPPCFRWIGSELELHLGEGYPAAAFLAWTLCLCKVHCTVLVSEMLMRLLLCDVNYHSKNSTPDWSKWHSRYDDQCTMIATNTTKYRHSHWTESKLCKLSEC